MRYRVWWEKRVAKQWNGLSIFQSLNFVIFCRKRQNVSFHNVILQNALLLDNAGSCNNFDNTSETIFSDCLFCNLKCFCYCAQCLLCKLSLLYKFHHAAVNLFTSSKYGVKVLSFHAAKNIILVCKFCRRSNSCESSCYGMAMIPGYTYEY